ncbi:hypothetical protein PRIPAC_96248 [Pristionchus pacificus]|uniref:Uncharacterized protein n=1 Tax=Pristionchus pacificus TaxID=54126 RepID=A0A2A6B2Y0_PRIPA|nr:hypothetical protein PRIPAC_96248 [Pristionchus pacificus]|eukprot:PDM60213.1 hypothetical protein PRIPAC_54038 [Pristionchus pacificus]
MLDELVADVRLLRLARCVRFIITHILLIDLWYRLKEQSSNHELLISACLFHAQLPIDERSRGWKEAGRRLDWLSQRLSLTLQRGPQSPIFPSLETNNKTAEKGLTTNLKARIVAMMAMMIKIVSGIITHGLQTTHVHRHDLQPIFASERANWQLQSVFVPSAQC